MACVPSPNGGYLCTTAKGRVLWSREPMDAADLAAHDEMLDELEAMPEVDDDDEHYEDPDSDGYGWERHALAGIG